MTTRRFPEGKEWRDYAACLNHDNDLFFPDPSNNEQAAEAKAICATCPVQNDCLEFILNASPVLGYGIWAGKTSKQLSRIRADRNRTRLKKLEAEYGPLSDCPCGAPLNPVPSTKFEARHFHGRGDLKPGRACPAAQACKTLARKQHAA